MQHDQIPVIARIIAGCFGITFGGIGLVTLGHLWLTPFGGFGAPPLFFRIFASLIAIPFVGIGLTGLYRAVMGKPTSTMGRHQLLQDRIMETALKKMAGRDADRAKVPSQLACPSCGAPRTDEEASPSGDVKCSHCDRWYNMYSSDGS